ncbi:HEPN domain-containing protein [Pseudomonas shirazensis]|uniref:HEPN domain-containing protein n=1 Tax=Pseudomonas shirazensis TaxID=2745494 RepID=A0ABU8ZUF7_9PSED
MPLYQAIYFCNRVKKKGELMGRTAEWAMEVLMEQDRERELDYEYEQYQAEMKWFEEHPILETYTIFTEKLKQLKLMMAKDCDPFDSQMLRKMAYVHAVTLFEAMIGDVLKATVLAYPSLMKRLISKLGEDKSRKFQLNEIAELGLNGIVLGILNEQLYHNPVTVKRFVSTITDQPMSDKHMALMQNVIEKRHDLAHRDGKTVNGELHEIDENIVKTSIETIENFAKEIFESLDAAMKNSQKV